MSCATLNLVHYIGSFSKWRKLRRRVVEYERAGSFPSDNLSLEDPGKENPDYVPRVPSDGTLCDQK